MWSVCKNRTTQYTIIIGRRTITGSECADASERPTHQETTHKTQHCEIVTDHKSQQHSILVNKSAVFYSEIL